MEYTILLIAHLFFALFFTAGVCAFASRLKQPFGRWFWPLTLTLVGVVYLVFGLILLSLAITRPKTENADTVAEEQV